MGESVLITERQKGHMIEISRMLKMVNKLAYATLSTIYTERRNFLANQPVAFQTSQEGVSLDCWLDELKELCHQIEVNPLGRIVEELSQ